MLLLPMDQRILDQRIRTGEGITPPGKNLGRHEWKKGVATFSDHDRSTRARKPGE